MAAETEQQRAARHSRGDYTPEEWRDIFAHLEQMTEQEWLALVCDELGLNESGQAAQAVQYGGL
ncbi:hypothetical protein [Pseudomonas urethralis]|uniref:hypothetical protein n=1 Tax=Pseudomonas urethralis TaxID=2740517 RepID=UPI00159643C9|nr:hypothetical protein [Pseudomonas urethralis]